MPQYLARRRQSWNESHHVVRSMGNHLAPKGQRTYFDHLPALRRRPHDVLAELASPRRPRPRSPRPARAASARRADAPSLDLLASAASAASTPLPGRGRRPVPPPTAPSPGPSAEPGSPRQAWPATPPSVASSPSTGARPRRKLARLLSEQERAGSGHHHPAYLQLAEWAEAKCSHMVAVWRRLDSNASGFLHRMELVQGLKEMDYPGKVDELWGCLDVDKRGTIAFFEFAPRSARLLASFKHWIYQTCGSCEKFFRAMDRDHNKKLALCEWKLGLQLLNLPENLLQSAETIFWLLDCCDSNYMHKNAVSGDELAFLDQWQCPPYFQGQADYAVQQAFHSAVVGRNRGNSILAWRSIDRDKNMVLSWDDFHGACKELANAGVPGAERVVEVYLCYDPEKTGMFSLRSWDPDAFWLLASFAVFSRARRGRPSSFVRALGDQLDGGVSIDAFDEATEELGLSNKDLETLFAGLAGFDERLYWRDATFLDHWDLDAEGPPPKLGRSSGGQLQRRRSSEDEAALQESRVRAARRAERRSLTGDFVKRRSFGSADDS